MNEDKQDKLWPKVKKSYFDLSGKVAIVTGGASGIGRSLAESLAEYGAKLIICGRRLTMCEVACNEIRKATGVLTFPIVCDVSKNVDVERVIKATINRFGHIDILINNAGIGGNEKEILEMTEKDWDAVISVNLMGAFYMSKAVAPYMISQRGGKIVNITSLAAFMGFSKMSSYSASKAGLVQLTKVMALEWVKYNIQVNAICPGYFRTPLNEHFFSTEAGKKVIEKRIPMKRLGDTKEIKGIAVFLSSEASNFMTGSIIIIDGGQSLV